MGSGDGRLVVPGRNCFIDEHQESSRSQEETSKNAEEYQDGGDAGCAGEVGHEPGELENVHTLSAVLL